LRLRRGQAIDVRGVALDVLDRMDPLDAARAMQTRMKGFWLLDAGGEALWRTEEGTLSGGSVANDDSEVQRDDLAALLLGALPAGVEVIQGDHITALDEDAQGMIGHFAGRASRRFALVIGADGVNSGVRDLVFGDERQFLHPLGFALANYSAPNHVALEDWLASTREGNAGCIVYTGHDNSKVRLCFRFPAASRTSIAATYRRSRHCSQNRPATQATRPRPLRAGALASRWSALARWRRSWAAARTITPPPSPATRCGCGFSSRRTKR
jgi:2-polyprenyl-6-methoxyphenol hydroxylase-like FAD-dependent oxidoreductase